jgi:RNA polymerase sigma-70 factor (ECF subfamily)
MMVSVARRILGDEVQAWDAVQEALVALWNEGEIPPNPRAWLARAVVLRSLHLSRCRARRRRHERRACERKPEASDRDDPTKSIEYEELAHTLDETLRTISPEYREVILLRTAADMDYAAIANTLQIPIGTVRSRLNRTRQVFREALFREMFPEGDANTPGAGDCS